jgi:hypothetical protein
MNEIQQALILLRFAGVYFFFQAFLCLLLIIAGLAIAFKMHMEAINHLGPYDKERIKQIIKKEKI